MSTQRRVRSAAPTGWAPAVAAGAGRRSDDRGAAAVEMALVLPLLLLLIFGIIDFGRMLNTQIRLTEAAREGARAAALGDDPTPRVTAIAGDESDMDINTMACGGDGDHATVTITYPFTFVTPVGLLGFGGQVTLTGKGAMPCQ